MTLFRYSVLALAATSMAGGLVAFAEPEFRSQAGAATNVVTLRPASDFENITNKDERAVALFKEAGKVIQSPRCMNCHPATERPSQTDGMKPHQPLVVRGDDGMGAPGGSVPARIAPR